MLLCGYGKHFVLRPQLRDGLLGTGEGWERNGLMVSVDVKHHVYFTWERKNEGSTARTDPEV